MKTIPMKYKMLAAALLLTLSVAYLMTTGRFEHFLLSNDADKPANISSVRNKIFAADPPRSPGGSDAKIDSGGPAAMVTRAFFKPMQSELADAVGLEITAVEQSGELVISGLLRDGSACNRLQIDFELEADDGRNLYHTLIIGSTGQTGEQPVRSKRRLPPPVSGSPAAWRTHVASIRCLDP